MEDMKKCPYCRGQMEIKEFSDGSGRLQCTLCCSDFEPFYPPDKISKEESINRFNKYIGK